MPSTFALSMSKWALDVASTMIKADVRLHNAEKIQDDMSVLFVVNHFTRLETLLLPYAVYNHTGKEVWSLAASELFAGRVGQFLRSVGSVSTEDPDRDKIIVRSLLEGTHPWMIFPEGAMIKDKKVVDDRGEYSVYNNGVRRAPHTGAAVLALRTEFYRHKLHCLADRPGQEGLDKVLEHFALPSLDPVFAKRTVIVPVNITYYPIRARENFLLRLAKKYSENLSERAVEELSVEGTVLSADTDIDITLGDPIDVREYLQAPEYAEVMACGVNDMEALELDDRSLFNDAARKLMTRYMDAIYRLTTINYDHIFATIIRHQPAQTFTERSYRNRIFLSAYKLKHRKQYRLHRHLADYYREIIYEDHSPHFSDFLELCLQEGILKREGNGFTRNFERSQGLGDFHTVRAQELAWVIGNEVEPLTDVIDLIKGIARQPRFVLSRRVREIMIEEDKRIFEEDYARFYDESLSKGPDVGRPFLLRPMRPKAGVVLCHGYMAAPLEVRALAEYLYHHGYAVYVVRMRGHGTTPEDLAQTHWEQWYESFNRGYAIIKSLTDKIFLGGFSTGGCLALLAAARKGSKAQGVFSICAPLQVMNYSIKLVPSVVAMNSILKRFGSTRWEYVENSPENKHINYTRNPLTGVRELVKIMAATEASLKDVNIPALIVQGSRDPVVNPASAQSIFEGIASPRKELTMLERDRHGIVNGAGSDEVHTRVRHFIERVRELQTEPAEPPSTEVAVV